MRTALHRHPWWQFALVSDSVDPDWQLSPQHECRTIRVLGGQHQGPIHDVLFVEI